MTIGSESTAALLLAARRGDDAARDRLARRLTDGLKRWARGRVPPAARGLLDTEDLVQSALLRAFQRIETFEARGPGAFLAYCRTVCLNLLRDELRRIGRRPSVGALTGEEIERAPSPLELAIGRDLFERYEAALAAMAPEHQEAIILRVEMGFPYDEVARSLGSASPDAARMTVSRALLRLAEALGVEGRERDASR